MIKITNASAPFKTLLRTPVGPPGPPGPEGPPGAASASVAKVASGALGGHRAVKAVGASNVTYIDPSAVEDFGLLLGITTAAASDGGSIGVQYGGEIDEPSWAWTPGMTVFCGPSGVLTQSYNPAWKWSQSVGVAVSPTRLWILLGPALKL